ncbi:Serpin B8 [Armadillidium nasatum]|uniref:Serpin B8 n=1 Tax=Armadillidium nasatum TaxID=96803 RepID=A0A5N5STL8_9CRUS|nr:Serpin B8 [Armadillidium nasatum]
MAPTPAFKTVLIVFSIYLLQKERFALANTVVCNDTDENFSKYDVVNGVHGIGKDISYAQWNKNPPPQNVIISPLRNEVEISIYTRLFPDKEFTILNSFSDVSETSYLSEVESLDYVNFPNASTERINNWVSDSTNGKIDKVFYQPLSPLTVCVIANVIFLNATWLNQFNSDSTRDGNFYTGTETITIPMMNRQMYVPYMRFDNERFEMISLPYVGNRSSMYILKPINGNNLKQLESTLTLNNLNTFISQMQSQKMDVTIPRMKLSFELHLKDDLLALGVNDIFYRESADFSRFTALQGVFVSAIAHKALLEVTEAGTVAAAVTVAVIGTTSIPPAFVLNEPSLIYIRDNFECLSIFYAKVMNPEPLLD